MEFFKIKSGKFVPCSQDVATFVRVLRNGNHEMIARTTAGMPRSARPLLDTRPKGRVHVFDIADKTPFSTGTTVARPERAAKIAAVRARREAQRAKAGGITKGEKAAAANSDTNAATTAATIAEFFTLVEKVENLINGGLFSAANEALAELRALATSVPNKQRTPLRNALRLLVSYKSEAVKSDREKRKETARHERTAKSAERAHTIKTRRDGIAAAKAAKVANAPSVRPSLGYTAKVGFCVSRQLADARNRERAKVG